MDIKILRSGLILPFFIFIIIGCFGFFNPETFLAIKGFFKLRDIAFILIFLIVLISISIKNTSIVIKKSPENVIIGILMAMVLFQILHSLWLYDVPFISIIQDCRVYLFYLLFFPSLYLLNTKEKIYIVLRIFLFLALFGSLIIIGATNFGEKFPLPIYLKTQLDIQILGGLYINRLYMPGSSLIGITFSVLFWLVIINKEIKYKFILIISTIITGIACLFTFSRAYWACIILSILTPLIFIKSVRKDYFKKIIFPLLIIFFLVIIIYIFFSGSFIDSIKYLTAIVKTTFNEITSQTGSFGYRIRESEFRFTAIKDNFFFGVGFLHPKYVSNYFQVPSFIANVPERQTMRSIDWGILNLLINFGIFGLLWFLSLVVLLHNKFKKLIIYYESKTEKSITIGVFGYFWGAILTFITFPHFVDESNIVLLVVSWAIIESLNRNREIKIIDED